MLMHRLHTQYADMRQFYLSESFGLRFPCENDKIMKMHFKRKLQDNGRKKEKIARIISRDILSILLLSFLDFLFVLFYFFYSYVV